MSEGKRWLRFEDDKLHEKFLSYLKSVDAPYELDESGTVHFAESDNPAINGAAHRVRDAQFRWYFLGTSTDEQAKELRSQLEREQLRFVVELSDFGTWFLVPREDKQKHQEMMQRYADEENERILAELEAEDQRE